ncbi:MAG: prepilin-type N-terminal cleavage/methylation domain-containing protein [Candidatus Saccharibacteria bacterium]|nr:prepilin-type N-terminal cleavage/methylation domain-containing protein [Candidatus Saccharibacteria bacterium]
MFKTLKTVQKGFTIIELLIVIAIIAILAGIVLNSVQGAQAKARDAQRVSKIGNIQTHLEQYYNEEGAYVAPTNTELNDPSDLFPGIDAETFVDADGDLITVTNVADEAAANTAIAGANAPTNDDEFQLVLWDDTCVTNCTGYLLGTYIEAPGDGGSNVEIKSGLNND